MKNTLDNIQRFAEEARVLDAQLVKKRASYVQRNLTDIEGVNRSDKYVERLAGKSADNYRKSRTEQSVEWLGATAIESLPQLLMVKAFYAQVFEYAETLQDFRVVRNFWAIDEQTACLEAARRMAVQAGDIARALELSMQIKRNEQEISEYFYALSAAGVKL